MKTTQTPLLDALISATGDGADVPDTAATFPDVTYAAPELAPQPAPQPARHRIPSHLPPDDNYLAQVQAVSADLHKRLELDGGEDIARALAYLMVEIGQIQNTPTRARLHALCIDAAIAFAAWGQVKQDLLRALLGGARVGN